MKSKDSAIDRRGLLTGAMALAIPLAVSCAPPANARKLPAPKANPRSAAASEVAIVAGGCFWGVQAVFAHVKGVTRAVSGYIGGQRANPTYEQVSSGTTGHAEAVQVTFDPKQVTYGEILQIFFSVATNPTEINRQGPDVGTQYRNEIFYTSPAQKQVADAYIAELNAAKVFSRPIATKVTAAPTFYVAEKYHQDYAFINPTSPYIMVHDAPKIADLRASFPDAYRAQPIRQS